MTYALYDHWSRFLHGGFDTKTEAFLWLLNHLPWRILPVNGVQERARVATEFEADVILEQTPGLRKIRCEVSEYTAYMEVPKHRYENSIH